VQWKKVSTFNLLWAVSSNLCEQSVKNSFSLVNFLFSFIQGDLKGYRQTETMGWGYHPESEKGCGGVHRTVFKLGPKNCSQSEVSAGTLKRAARITVAK